MLAQWVGEVLPFGGKILELGSQDVNIDVDLGLIRDVIAKLSGPGADHEALVAKYCLSSQPRKIAKLFEGTSIVYAAIDAYPGERIVVADLNTHSAPENERGTIDLVTNFGTSEHVADQINLFRLVHDYVRPGGHMFHTVPFTGYYNHGLYNYHPVFFFFLAWANRYRIVTLNLSSPHFPYNIPVEDWMPGSENWSKVRFDSGMVSCLLQKVDNRPFELFTDIDRSMLKEHEEPEKLKVLDGRYDLRIRS